MIKFSRLFNSLKHIDSKRVSSTKERTLSCELSDYNQADSPISETSIYSTVEPYTFYPPSNSTSSISIPKRTFSSNSNDVKSKMSNEISIDVYMKYWFSILDDAERKFSFGK